MFNQCAPWAIDFILEMSNNEQENSANLYFQNILDHFSAPLTTRQSKALSSAHLALRLIQLWSVLRCLFNLPMNLGNFLLDKIIERCSQVVFRVNDSTRIQEPRIQKWSLTHVRSDLIEIHKISETMRTKFVTQLLLFLLVLWLNIPWQKSHFLSFSVYLIIMNTVLYLLVESLYVIAAFSISINSFLYLELNIVPIWVAISKLKVMITYNVQAQRASWVDFFFSLDRSSVRIVNS